MLAKSEFGIDKKFTCIFDEIDNPTEKERAEIRKINADTDAVYINAGVVSPDEIRTVLRADEKSGYNALGEEMQGSPKEENDPFADIEGGSSTEQDPFSMDDDKPKDWFTSNGAHIPIEEGETKNASFKEFKKEKKKEDKDLKYSYKNQYEKMLELDISEAEFHQVNSEINNVYHTKYKNKKQFTHTFGKHIYKLTNNGFNNYAFNAKINIEEYLDVLDKWKNKNGRAETN